MKRVPIICLLLAVSAVPRLWAGEHPVPLEKGVDTAKCLECHEDKGKGKFVHSVIATGCTACHDVKTEKETTTINLILPKEELCFTCHEKSSEPVQHGPYGKGQCVKCHDPHTGDYEKQLRAEGNTLCLECHLQRRTSDANVTLFKSIRMSDADFQQIPKVGLDPTLKFGHPMGRHAVAGAPDTLNPGKKMSCLSCHNQHAASKESLVKMVEVKGEAQDDKSGEKKTEVKKMDVCDACHLANDNSRMAEAQKRMDEIEAQRQKEQELQKKGSLMGPQKRPDVKKSSGNN